MYCNECIIGLSNCSKECSDTKIHLARGECINCGTKLYDISSEMIQGRICRRCNYMIGDLSGILYDMYKLLGEPNGQQYVIKYLLLFPSRPLKTMIVNYCNISNLFNVWQLSMTKIVEEN